MRVLQLITSTRSFYEQQVEALEARGIECTTVSVPGTYAADSPHTVWDYVRYYPKVLDHSLDEYDLVHANYGLVGPFALAQPTRPVVLSLWGTDLLGDYGWLRTLSRTSARLADAVVVPSEPMAEALGRPASLIPFGVNMDLFEPEPKQEARQRLGWDDEPVVLFPYDRNREEKDFPRAKRVVERLESDARLHEVTDATHEEMPTYMNAADALLVTSRHEAGPMAVKEAAACNLPVVSTDVGFVRETLDGVSRSQVCETTDELVAALDAVLAAGERSDGRQAVRSDSVSRLGDRLATLYRETVEGS